MMGVREQEFARLVEWNDKLLGMLAGENVINLELLWRVLIFLFGLDSIVIYESNHKHGFHESFGFATSLVKKTPSFEDCGDLVQAAFAENKPQSKQLEEPVSNGTTLVDAIAAIPVVIEESKKVITIYKRLEVPQLELVEGYAFDSYRLQLYNSVINGLIRLHAQNKQLAVQQDQIAEQQMRLSQNRDSVVRSGRHITLAAIAAGLFALLEGLSAAIGILKDSTVVDVLQGLLVIAVLVLIFGTAVRLAKFDKRADSMLGWLQALKRLFKPKK